MTLGFQTHINGRPTFFVEKIWSGLREKAVDEYFRNWVSSKYNTGKNILDLPPKIHTIREDKGKRWEAGKDIHMAIKNRIKDRLQFAPVIPCVSVQEIIIKHRTSRYKGQPCKEVSISLGGPSKEIWRLMTIAAIVEDEVFMVYKGRRLERLAQNDGFDSVKEFLDYFNEDFTGRIIHWTNFKYS